MPRMQRFLILLAAVAAVLVAVSPAAAAKRKVPRGFYAVMWDRAATKAPPAEQEAQWSLMARSGVESVRTVFSWAVAQPEPGVVDFSVTDQVVGLGARHNIEVLPVVRTTPTWAAINPYAPGSPPARPSDYTAFLTALIARYGPGGSYWVEHPELRPQPIRAWQIWNEPHLNVWWNTESRGRYAWVPEYAALLKVSAAAVRQADPGAKVVLAALADFAWDHMARLNRQKIGRFYDIAAINLFTEKPKNVLRGVRRVRAVMSRGGARRKPIWLTESTWPAGKGRLARPGASWQRAWFTTDEGMAQRLRAMYALSVAHRRQLKLGRLVWYTWSSGYADTDLFDYSGLLRFWNGAYEPRPALAAYAASARRFQGCVKTSAGACR